VWGTNRNDRHVNKNVRARGISVAVLT